MEGGNAEMACSRCQLAGWGTATQQPWQAVCWSAGAVAAARPEAWGSHGNGGRGVEGCVAGHKDNAAASWHVRHRCLGQQHCGGDVDVHNLLNGSVLQRGTAAAAVARQQQRWE